MFDEIMMLIGMLIVTLTTTVSMTLIGFHSAVTVFVTVYLALSMFELVTMSRILLVGANDD